MKRTLSMALLSPKLFPTVFNSVEIVGSKKQIERLNCCGKLSAGCPNNTVRGGLLSCSYPYHWQGLLLSLASSETLPFPLSWRLRLQWHKFWTVLKELFSICLSIDHMGPVCKISASYGFSQYLMPFGLLCSRCFSKPQIS